MSHKMRGDYSNYFQRGQSNTKSQHKKEKKTTTKNGQHSIQEQQNQESNLERQQKYMFRRLRGMVMQTNFKQGMSKMSKMFEEPQGSKQNQSVDESFQQPPKRGFFVDLKNKIGKIQAKPKMLAKKISQFQPYKIFEPEKCKQIAPNLDVKTIPKQNQNTLKRAIQQLAAKLLQNREVNLFVMRTIYENIFNRKYIQRADHPSSKDYFQLKSNFHSFQPTTQSKPFSQKFENIPQTYYQWVLYQFRQIDGELNKYLQNYYDRITVDKWIDQFLRGQLYKQHLKHLKALDQQTKDSAKAITLEPNNLHAYILGSLFFLCINTQLKSILEKKVPSQKKNTKSFNPLQMVLDFDEHLFHCQNILSKLKLDNIQKFYDESHSLDYREQRFNDQQVTFQVEQDSSQPIFSEQMELIWKQADQNLKFKLVLDSIRLLNYFVDNGIGVRFSHSNFCQKHNTLLVKIYQSFTISKPLEQIKKSNKLLGQILDEIVYNFYEILLKKKKNQSNGKKEKRFQNARLFPEAIRKFGPLYPQKLKQEEQIKRFTIIQSNIQFILKLIDKLFDKKYQLFHRQQDESNTNQIVNSFQTTSIQKLAEETHKIQQKLKYLGFSQQRIQKMKLDENLIQKQKRKQSLSKIKRQVQKAKIQNKRQVIQNYFKTKIQQIGFRFSNAFYKQLRYKQYKFMMAMPFYNRYHVQQQSDSPIYKALSGTACEFFTQNYQKHRKRASGVIGYKISVNPNPKHIKISREQMKQGSQFILHGMPIQDAQRLIISLLFPQKRLEGGRSGHLFLEEKELRKKQQRQKLSIIQSSQYAKKSKQTDKFLRFMRQQNITAGSIQAFAKLVRNAIANQKEIRLPLLTINHIVMIRRQLPTKGKENSQNELNVSQYLSAVPKIDVLRAIIDECKAQYSVQQYSHEQRYLRNLIKKLDLDIAEHNNLIFTILMLSTITKQSYKQFLSKINNCSFWSKYIQQKSNSQVIIGELAQEIEQKNNKVVGIISKDLYEQSYSQKPQVCFENYCTQKRTRFQIQAKEYLHNCFADTKALDNATFDDIISTINFDDETQGLAASIGVVFKQYNTVVYPYIPFQLGYQVKEYRYTGDLPAQGEEERITIERFKKHFSNMNYYFLQNNMSNPFILGVVTDVKSQRQNTQERHLHFKVTIQSPTQRTNEQTNILNQNNNQFINDLEAERQEVIRLQMRKKKDTFRKISHQRHNGRKQSIIQFIFRLFDILETAKRGIQAQFNNLNIATLSMVSHMTQIDQIQQMIPYFFNYDQMKRFSQPHRNLNQQTTLQYLQYIKQIPYNLGQRYGRIWHHERYHCIFNYPLYANKYVQLNQASQAHLLEFKLDIGNLALIICQFLHKSSLPEHLRDPNVDDNQFFIDDYQQLVLNSWISLIHHQSIDQTILSPKQQAEFGKLKKRVEEVRQKFDSNVRQLIHSSCHMPFESDENERFANLLANMMKVDLLQRIDIQGVLDQIRALKQFIHWDS